MTRITMAYPTAENAKGRMPASGLNKREENCKISLSRGWALILDLRHDEISENTYRLLKKSDKIFIPAGIPK